MAVESSFVWGRSSWVIQKKDDSEFQARILKKYICIFTNVENIKYSLKSFMKSNHFVFQ